MVPAETRVLSISLYGSECWAATKEDAWEIDALDQLRLQ